VAKTAFSQKSFKSQKNFFWAAPPGALGHGLSNGTSPVTVARKLWQQEQFKDLKISAHLQEAWCFCYLRHAKVFYSYNIAPCQ
jgi:hypothetical protein